MTVKCSGIVGCGCYLLSSIVVITPNGNFWVVPLLHSVGEVFTLLMHHTSKKNEVLTETRGCLTSVTCVSEWNFRAISIRKSNCSCRISASEMRPLRQAFHSQMFERAWYGPHIHVFMSSKKIVLISPLAYSSDKFSAVMGRRGNRVSWRLY